jgi:hypothetical protein
MRDARDISPEKLARAGRLGLLSRRVCRPAGPSSDECHTGNGIFGPFHLGLNSFQESIYISQAFKRKIELLHLRQQSAKKILDPRARLRDHPPQEYPVGELVRAGLPAGRYGRGQGPSLYSHRSVPETRE